MSSRPGPSRNLFRALAHSLWVLASTGWEAVVWGNVRAGSIRLAGSPLSFRLLIRLGLWLVMGLLGMLLLADAWRRISPLLPLVFYTNSLSGLYAPQLFVPVMFGLLSLAWAYVLAGGLHSPWPLKLAVLVLFGLFDISLNLSLATGVLSEISALLTGLGGGAWSLLAMALHIVGWLVLLALFVWRWRRPVRLGLEFPLLLGATGVMFLSSYLATLLSNRLFQAEATAAALQLTQTLQVVGVFLTPFLVLAGVEVAEFGLQLTRQAAGYLGRAPRLRQGNGRRAWIAGLAFFLLIRLLAQWLVPLLRQGELPWRVGAALSLVVLLMLFAVTRGRVAGTALPVWVLPLSAVLLYGLLVVIQVTAFFQVIFAVVALTLRAQPDAILDATERFFAFLAESNEFWVALVVWSIAGVQALRAMVGRRRLPASAVYLGVLGLWLVWWVTTRTGERLDRFNFDYVHLSALATPVLLLVLAALALARRLTPRNLLYLTAAAVLLAMLEFQALLSDPLSPLFGLLGAEAALLSVSIFLNVMAAGNRFGLNDESARFPRTARGLLYFGYALLTVTTVNWLAAAHHASALSTNEQLTQNGYLALGLPLAFWALLVGSDELMGESPLADA